MLARWSSWGAIPNVFDESKADWASEREQLKSLLDEDAYAAARRTTINAHYTDPAYVREIWSALGDLGFEQGKVLEPGVGAGTFVGMAPQGASMVGVELDPTTASITRGLYPQADIRTESFAETRLGNATFDAAVGNVPFADIRLHDPVHNAGNHSIHNHFINKSLALTRPGGLVAVLTSSYTMDAINPAARREMNDKADLLGAVRLPTGAHQRAAGTQAITDLLVFRRRDLDAPKRDVSWETTSSRDVDGTRVKINTYFDIHPQHVLGEMGMGSGGMYGQDTVQIRAQDMSQVPGQLREALGEIVATAKHQGLTMTEASQDVIEHREQITTYGTDLWDGTLVAVEGGFQVAKQNRLEHQPIGVKHHPELRSLLGLRDGAKALLEHEASSADDSSELAAKRQDLAAQYEKHVERYGPLNRNTESGTGRFSPVVDELTGSPVLNPDTGEPELIEGMMRRYPPATRVLRSDPFGPLVMALEEFDEASHTARPATMLSERVVLPRPLAQGAETPHEAIALSMNESGTVSLDRIADLLGIEPGEAREQLSDLVYDDPVTERIVPAEEYLSGNVRTKLAAAEAAAQDDERFAVNVTALREVIPVDLGPAEIEAQVGAVWISPQVHQQFLRDLLADPRLTVENPLPGEWKVKSLKRGSLEATDEWGTGRRPATDLFESLLKQTQIKVEDTFDDGTKVFNPVETTAAQEKADALAERFSEWVWEDPARAVELSGEYNQRFNSIVLRDYAKAGEFLTFPGMSETMTPRPHQRAAVARMIAEPAVGLFHEVGAGKTIEMIAGATELRRLGMITKPAIVVPNHMLEQFTREWLEVYPQARILAASSKDLGAGRRQEFIARAAANDWDGVVLTQEAFKSLGVSPQVSADYAEREIATLRDYLDAANETELSPMSVKQIENKISKAEENLKKDLDKPKDAGLTFEETGIDYLLVDEAHTYKNLRTESKIPGASIDGSQAAKDLDLKLDYLREKHGGRVATFATATPLANSVTEAFVMQKYLRPDLLEQAGISSFDTWAATFGQTTTDMEMGPAGGFRIKTRFAKFQNVPEMLKMWHVFADVKTAEDLNLPVPQIAQRRSDGKREVDTVVLEPTPALEDYIADIAERAQLVADKAVEPEEDNMLKISGDGRKAALDMRMVDPGAEPEGFVKLDAVADRVAAQWRDTRENEYLDSSGEVSPIKGGLQLVFCDLGTPNTERWSAYTELRNKLVERGLPAESVRFMHEAKNDSEKGRLFAAARSGHIAVLLGSTQKMGVGTNVQNRLTGLHHVDCPWRPADLQQRDGRAIRQGNQNPEVSLTRYVVERSFDAYSWQTVARKAEFINQVMKGKLDSREMEDIGNAALSATEAKALASGNPLVMEQASATAALSKLQRQQTAFYRSQSALEFTRSGAQRDIDRASPQLAQLEAVVSRSVDTAGDKFRMNIGERDFTKRADAAAAIADWTRSNEHDLKFGSAPLLLGSVGGHDLVATPSRVQQMDYSVEFSAMIELDGVPRSGQRVPVETLSSASVGTVMSLENKVAAIPRSIERVRGDVQDAHQTVEDINQRLAKPFAHTQDLADAKERVAEVKRAMADKEAEDNPRVAPDESASVSVDAVRGAAFSGRHPGGSSQSAVPTMSPPRVRSYRANNPSERGS